MDINFIGAIAFCAILTSSPWNTFKKVVIRCRKGSIALMKRRRGGVGIMINYIRTTNQKSFIMDLVLLTNVGAGF